MVEMDPLEPSLTLSGLRTRLLAAWKLSGSSTARKDGLNVNHPHETGLELELRTRAMYGNTDYAPIVESRDSRAVGELTWMSIDRRLVF